MPLIRLCIFLSAFLLFSVQPLYTKKLLPLFGGSSAVWLTALLFFQAILLLGYGYAHFTITRGSGRQRLLVHGCLLLVATLSLFLFNSQHLEASSRSVQLDLLIQLCLGIGLPYLALSATSPLLQGVVGHKSSSNLYALYALSNLGSLIALVSYPALIEPQLGLRIQGQLWLACFTLFAAMTIAVLWRARNEQRWDIFNSSRDPLDQIKKSSWLYWNLLSATSNGVLLAETNQLSQSIASSPFVWLVPLTLYLITYSIAFAFPLRQQTTLTLFAVGVILKLLGVEKVFNNTPLFLLAAQSFYLFSTCLFCHSELARTKPAQHNSTRFYFICASGGASGALFVAIVATHIFSAYYEAGIFLALALIVAAQQAFTHRHKVLALACGLLACFGAAQLFRTDQSILESRRSFYGVVAVGERNPEAADFHFYRMFHGPVVHGLQFNSPAKELLPTTYYGPSSGVGLVMSTFRTNQARRIAVVGLGTGTLAVYGQKTDHLDFYEIDRNVQELAQKYFTFLSKSEASIEHVLGDARLTLANSTSKYDLIVVDAFSGDAVPAHLLTKEALEMYQGKLKPGGMILIHVSNLHLNLAAVVAATAAAVGLPSYLVKDEGTIAAGQRESSWVIVPISEFGPELLQQLPQVKKLQPSKNPQFSWSDDFTTLLPALVY